MRNEGECIEVSYKGRKQHKFFTVREYGAMWRRGEKGSLYRAPPVQDLTTEGRGFRTSFVSVCEREEYDQQMRKLLGLDWLMAPDK